MLPVHSEAEANQLVCWERPPRKYVLGKDEPWVSWLSAPAKVTLLMTIGHRSNQSPRRLRRISLDGILVYKVAMRFVAATGPSALPVDA